MGKNDPDRLPDEVTISVERMIRFCHLVDITLGLSSPEPPREDEPLHLTPFGTMLTLTISFMYSLFEPRDDSINVVRIWQGFDHPFKDDLHEIEHELEPYRQSLRLVRNRYDFHGSLSREHEAAGFDVYNEDQAPELFALSRQVRELCGRMIEWFRSLPTEDEVD